MTRAPRAVESPALGPTSGQSGRSGRSGRPVGPAGSARSARSQDPGWLRGEAVSVRAVGDRLGVALWVVAGIALLFTMANVTTFATAHGTPWQIAWLLDPMASLALLVVLVGDGVLARHGVRGGGWARAVKLGAGTATWSMNVWASVEARDVAGVVLHSVAPALVIGLAEATPAYRARFAALADALQDRADALDALGAVHAALTPAPPPAGRVPTQRGGSPGSSPIGPAGSTDRQGPDACAAASAPGGESARTPERTPGRTETRTEARTERRSEVELERLVREAVAAGELPASPSGTAIQRLLGGGKTPAVRVAARLAEHDQPLGSVDVGPVEESGLARAGVAS